MVTEPRSCSSCSTELKASARDREASLRCSIISSRFVQRARSAIANERIIARTDCSFPPHNVVDIDSIANGTYINNKMQWCVQNREFTTVPMGITADGLEHTVNIDNEGKTYAIATAAATYCLSKVFAIGDIELQGFLGAVQQKYALTANEKELNAMLAYVRPEAAYTFSKFFDTQTWTSDQFSSYFAYLCSRSANNLVRNNSGAVEPFYAF